MTPTEVQARANAVWDARYAQPDAAAGDAAADPVTDYTRSKYLYEIAVAEPLTGRRDGYWLDDVGKLLGREARVLSIGCGEAAAEEYLVAHDYVGSLIGFDASRSAIETARQRVAPKPYKSRLHFDASDVLDANLETGEFDAVFALASLHHCVEIERVFALVHRVLKRDGLLIYDEYVGPDHHILPSDVYRLMDKVNALLPERLKVDLFTGQSRARVAAPSLAWMMDHDPTEGIHSSRILPLTYQYFDIIRRRGYGGTLIRQFFAGILQNFDFESADDRCIAGLIVLLEEELARTGALPYHALNVVARRRDDPGSPLSGADIARIGFADWAPPR
jgi:SAM-dependent methyltransferase